MFLFVNQLISDKKLNPSRYFVFDHKKDQVKKWKRLTTIADPPWTSVAVWHPAASLLRCWGRFWLVGGRFWSWLISSGSWRRPTASSSWRTGRSGRRGRTRSWWKREDDTIVWRRSCSLRTAEGFLFVCKYLLLGSYGYFCSSWRLALCDGFKLKAEIKAQ